MTPIFIIGCQRSGSTMLGALLGGNEKAIAIPEAQFVAELAPVDPLAEVNLATIIDAIQRHYRFQLWNFELGAMRPAGNGSYAEAIRWLVRTYAAHNGQHDPAHWIDHQPGHVREMQELRAHFPDLKVVHIVRDGRAVAASLIPLNWGPNAILSAANFWSQRVGMALALRQFLGDAHWIQVRYEDLVQNPDAELERLCAFLGLEFDPRMSAGDGFKVPAFTQNQHALVGKRPDPSRLQSWRASLSRREIEIFEALVGPLLTYLGYQRDFDHDARLPDFAEKMRMTIKDQVLAIRRKRLFEKRVSQFST
jgi:Sulfotransferase family